MDSTPKYNPTLKVAHGLLRTREVKTFITLGLKTANSGSFLFASMTSLYIY